MSLPVQCSAAMLWRTNQTRVSPTSKAKCPTKITKDFLIYLYMYIFQLINSHILPYPHLLLKNGAFFLVAFDRQIIF